MARDIYQEHANLKIEDKREGEWKEKILCFRREKEEVHGSHRKTTQARQLLAVGLSHPTPGASNPPRELYILLHNRNPLRMYSAQVRILE